MANNGFFVQVVPTHHHPFSKSSLTAAKTITDSEATFVDLGGTGDCGFRAIAAGLINKRRANQPLLARLLEAPNYYLRWPEHSGRLLTPSERLESVLKKPDGVAQVIYELAYKLRQLAVDELCAHPECYRGAFADINESTTPADMRQPTTWIDESAIAALSNVLALPITVHVVATGKELPLRLQYGTQLKTASESIVIRLTDNHYTAQVSDPVPFAFVAHKTMQPVLPLEPSRVASDPELSEILARIKAEDERLVADYEHSVHRLTVMIAADELTKDDLLTMYISGMQHSDYLTGRVKYVGLEHGSQQFFTDALNNARDRKTVVSAKPEHYETLIINELVHALARAISIGQLDENKVFAQLDQPSYRPGAH